MSTRVPSRKVTDCNSGVCLEPTQMDRFNLNHPYYVYPGYPFAGYSNFERYNKNVLKLFDTFTELNSNVPNKTLFHLTIGATMEEVLQFQEGRSFLFQWRQLFPDHLLCHAKSGGKVIHIIVSPTPSFDITESSINILEGGDDIVTPISKPRFVKETPEFEWEISGNIITSKTYDIQVIICYTMMPTVDIRNNFIHTYLTTKPELQIYADLILQTECDILFVSEFYKSLDSLVNNIIKHGGVATCFSFAVFNENTKKKTVRDYNMFKEIQNCFSYKKHQNVLLAEWMFMHGCYIVILPTASYTTIKYINFPDDDKQNKRIVLTSNENSLFLLLE